MDIKRIAIVSDAIYPFNKGGKEKRIHDITTRLVAEKYRVTIYCMKWWKGEKTIIQDGVTLHAISPYYPLYSGNRRSIKEAIFFALNCLKLISEDFDIIEIDHMPHLVLFTTKIVCLLKRKKMIVTWHEVWGLAYWRKYLGSIMGTIAYAVEKIGSHLPDTIVSVSAFTTNNLRTMLGVKNPIITIPNGLDFEGIAKSRPAKNGADVVFAGRLLSHKNVDVLLQAIHILKKERPNISLAVVGEGPELASLKNLAASLDIKNNVSFLGFLNDQDELYGIMQASRMLALPSTREGFGIVVLEANTCGIPVITIDHENNAAKELVTNGENGLLVKLDAIDLAKAIASLLDSHQDPIRYKSYAEPYDWGHIISKVQYLYAS